MSEFSIVGFIELQSSICNNYEISTIYYDEEQKRLYIGTFYGCLFVYNVMSEHMHIRLYAVQIQNSSYIQQIFKDAFNNLVILSLEYSSDQQEKQTYKFFIKQINELDKLQETQRYTNQLFEIQYAQFEQLDFPIDFKEQSKYIERIYTIQEWNLMIDGVIIQYLVESYDGLYYMYIQNNHLHFGCFFTHFSNLKISEEYIKQKQDVYISKSHIFIQINNYLVCLQFNPSVQRYLILCTIKSEQVISDIFTSQYTIEFNERQLVYQPDPSQIKVYVKQNLDISSGINDQIYSFEDAITQFDNAVVGAFILDRTIDLYEYNNQIVKIQDKMFYTKSSVNILIGLNSKYYQTYCMQKEYQIEQVFGRYLVVKQENYRIKSKKAETIDRYLILITGEWLYQTYDAFFPGFQTVNQNVVYFEREDEYDDEPDNELYDHNFPLRSRERVKQQVKTLLGYERPSEPNMYQFTAQELKEFI